MNFLVDNNLSPQVSTALASASHDAVHVRDIGLADAPDEAILEHARREDRVVVSADTDFGTLLARTHASGPSFLLLRRTSGRRATEQADVILENLGVVAGDLEHGAVVVIEQNRIRVRALPIGDSG